MDWQDWSDLRYIRRCLVSASVPQEDRDRARNMTSDLARRLWLELRAAEPKKPKAKSTAVMNENTVIDTCDQGHKFAKLEDHPTKDGRARCPHCMVIGLRAARVEIASLDERLAFKLRNEGEQL